MTAMFLIFDTETTGLPRSFNAPIADVDNWPRVVQLAWEVFGVCGRRKPARSELISPDGFTIPIEAERVHGISTEVARRSGVPIAVALGAFFGPLVGASLLIAHTSASMRAFSVRSSTGWGSRIHFSERAACARS